MSMNDSVSLTRRLSFPLSVGRLKIELRHTTRHADVHASAPTHTQSICALLMGNVAMPTSWAGRQSWLQAAAETQGLRFKVNISSL